MVKVFDQLKYYQTVQMLYLWQTRTMEHARRAELRRLEGAASARSELTRAAYAFILKVITMARKIMSHIPTPIIDENENNHTQ